VLRDIEGLTIDQIAEVLDVSHTAVKARLWRARLQLREGSGQPHIQGGMIWFARGRQVLSQMQLDWAVNFQDVIGDEYHRSWTPSLCGLQLLQIGQHFLAMTLRTDLKIDLSDYARRIDQKGVAGGQSHSIVLHDRAVFLSDRMGRIGEQLEV